MEPWSCQSSTASISVVPDLRRLHSERHEQGHRRCDNGQCKQEKNLIHQEKRTEYEYGGKERRGGIVFLQTNRAMCEHEGRQSDYSIDDSLVTTCKPGNQRRREQGRKP